MSLPFINVFDPDVSGDIFGLAMTLLALLVAIAILVPSTRALIRHRHRHV